MQYLQKRREAQMNLSKFVDKNVRITRNDNISFNGYVVELFPGRYNDDGVDSIGVLRKKGETNGIELSVSEIKKIEILN